MKCAPSAPLVSSNYLTNILLQSVYSCIVYLLNSFLETYVAESFALQIVVILWA